MPRRFTSCATASHGLCIWPLIPTVTAAGNALPDRVAQRLWAQGSKAFPVELPDEHDPNSFFVSGGDARQFRLLLQRAHS